MNEHLENNSSGQNSIGIEELRGNRQSAATDSEEKSSLLELMQKLAFAANEAQSIDQVLKSSLAEICKFSNWATGHAFLLDEKGEHIESSDLWYGCEEPSSEEMTAINGMQSDLVTAVMSTMGPVWLKEVPDYSCRPFSRRPESGPLAGCAFPVLIENRVAAILEFFFDHPAIASPNLLETLQQIGTQLGHVLRRQRAEERLSRSREQLRALSAHLQFVREQERTRVAREIHDELGQLLTILKIQIAIQQKQIQDQDAAMSKEVQLRELDELSGHVDTAMRSVRRMIAELRPEVLDYLGLEAAIEWQATEFQNRTGIQCHSELDFPHKVDSAEATTVFRIFQETLTNIARHSAAKDVWIHLSLEKENAVLTVRDNGKGVREEDLSSSRSFGILGMRERALLLGGHFEIKGRQNEGTSVTLRIPVQISAP